LGEEISPEYAGFSGPVKNQSNSGLPSLAGFSDTGFFDHKKGRSFFGNIRKSAYIFLFSDWG